MSAPSSGVLRFGDNLVASAEDSFIYRRGIRFGRDCMIAWDTLFMDTDVHSLLDRDWHMTNEDEEIVIGNHVWIGCRCLFLKGLRIADDYIIGANALVCGHFDDSRQIIAGNPAKVVKKESTSTCSASLGSVEGSTLISVIPTMSAGLCIVYQMDNQK